MIHYITMNGIGDAWIATELNVINSHKIPFVLHALRETDRSYHSDEWVREIRNKTRAIYPIEPVRFLTSVILAPIFFKKRFFQALANALFGERESLLIRLKSIFHFLVACHWARQLRQEKVSHIHCQWAHSSCTIGMYGAWFLGKTFSFTGHGADVFRDCCALKDKIKRADFIICISTFHRDYYKKLGATDEKLFIAYCGVDTERFKPTERMKNKKDRMAIISAGRLVEKKGFEYLIQACKMLLERDMKFECTIAGTGPLESKLRKQISELRLDGFVRLTGSVILQHEIPEFMYKGDVFCLPCVRAVDKDMDGIPCMLMEAMACGIPTISTRVSGIPDLVINNKTGVLLEPKNPEQLAEAILSLKNDIVKSAGLARAGREHVVKKFNMLTALDPLIQIYEKNWYKMQAKSEGEWRNNIFQKNHGGMSF